MVVEGQLVCDVEFGVEEPRATLCNLEVVPPDACISSFPFVGSAGSDWSRRNKRNCCWSYIPGTTALCGGM